MASYVLANIHGVWDRYSKKNETYLVSDPIKNVVLERMVVKQYLKQFVEFHNKFQMIIDTIKESDLRFNIIRYEHLNDDLEKIGFNITELKSSEIISYKDDHYERVTDKLLFQNMIEQFYEKL
jgi:hypothetical protein